MTPWWARLPVLLAAAVLLVGGAIQLRATDDESGPALLAAGLVCLGAWIAGEAGDRHRDDD